MAKNGCVFNGRGKRGSDLLPILIQTNFIVVKNIRQFVRVSQEVFSVACRAEDIAYTIEQYDREPSRVIASAVKQAVGLLWVPPERKRPLASRRTLFRRANPSINAKPTGSVAIGQIDQADGCRIIVDFNLAEAAAAKIGLRYEAQLKCRRYHAGTESLNERAMRISSKIEHAVLSRRRIEAIIAIGEVKRDR